jgi:hypothetical protein
MDTYSVEKDSDGWFQVRLTNRDGSRQVLSGFPAEQKAVDWLHEQNQIAVLTAIASDVA